MEIAAYLAALDDDGDALAGAAARAGLTAPVPTCPGWQVRDLLRHVAYAHRWAARHVTERLATVAEQDPEAAILAGGPPDDELLSYYRQGLDDLLAALGTAGPDLACATFLAAPSPLAFWARRQAHETAVHRYDVQSTPALPGPAGPPDPLTAFGPAFAADGIDELIMGFAARRRYRLRGDEDRSLAVATADWPGSWLIELADGRISVRREPGPAVRPDCLLTGPAAGLYAFLWHRCSADQGRVTVAGDHALLALWSASVRVTW